MAMYLQVVGILLAYTGITSTCTHPYLFFAHFVLFFCNSDYLINTVQALFVYVNVTALYVFFFKMLSLHFSISLMFSLTRLILEPMLHLWILIVVQITVNMMILSSRVTDFEHV